MNDINSDSLDWEFLAQHIDDLNKNRVISIIENRDDNKVYVSDFKDGRGKYINMYIKEDPESFQVSKQIQISLTYIKQNEKVTGIKLTKVKNGQDDGVISLKLDGVGKLIGILDFLKTIDIPMISTQKISIQDNLIDLDDETKRKLITLFSDETKKDFLFELISETDIHDAIRVLFSQETNKKALIEQIGNGLITSHDIVNIGYRKEQLNNFENILTNVAKLSKYKDHIKKVINKEAEIKDEKAWQYFFKNNEWIFGYGLSYKFYGILQDEFHASDTTPSGSEGVISDFLLADNNFTVIVEIKKSDTPLFKKQQNRANSWKLSNELIESCSQILEQKASAQIKFETNQSNNYDSSGKLITQKMYDPKCILIVGNLDNELKDISDQEKKIKLKTFELFRRDSRNIEIITFDELYNRAKFIVENGK